MQNNNNRKKVAITLILTDSTAGLLELNVPRLDEVCSENSKICIITGSNVTNFSKSEQIDSEKASCSSVTEDSSLDNSCPNDIYNKIQSGHAYFSTRSFSSSSCTIPEISNEEISLSKENSFEAIPIKNRTLASVRSMAHTNKLRMVSNNIYVAVLDSDSQCSMGFICRICHGGESIEDLMETCRCRGSIALVHLNCLEHWLKESSHSYCELCQHHYKLILEPQFGTLWSIFMFLKNPGEHLRTILLDLLAFAVYTPSAVGSTYMLLMICESLARSNLVSHGSVAAHIIAVSAIFGMATIDFTYSLWFMSCLQRHYNVWKEWYRKTSKLKIILSKVKQPRKSHRN